MVDAAQVYISAVVRILGRVVYISGHNHNHSHKAHNTAAAEVEAEAAEHDEEADKILEVSGRALDEAA